MSLPEYSDYVEWLGHTDAELARELAGFQSVSSVLDWMQPRCLSSSSIDMVGMDEFEYDFLVKLSSNESWLVFGVT